LRSELFVFHNQQPVVFEKFVADIIDKSVFRAVFVGFKIREIIEIKTGGGKFGFGGFHFPVCKILGNKNPVILPQFVVNIPHQIGRIFVQFVVVGISAIVITEFFIGAPDDFFATF
jgi:hypothetical protein